MSDMLQIEMCRSGEGGVLTRLNSDVDSFLKGPGY